MEVKGELSTQVDSLPLPTGASTSANQGLINKIDYIVGNSGIDASTETLQTIDYAHHEIHSGSSFTASYQIEAANAANMDILMVTPDTTKEIHFIYEIDVEGEAQLYIYETPTATAAANPIVAYNRNRIGTPDDATFV